MMNASICGLLTRTVVDEHLGRMRRYRHRNALPEKCSSEEPGKYGLFGCFGTEFDAELLGEQRTVFTNQLVYNVLLCAASSHYNNSNGPLKLTVKESLVTSPPPPFPFWGRAYWSSHFALSSSQRRCIVSRE